MSGQKKYYLARQGKLFGPLGEEHFNSLKVTPEFHDYEWYWDGLTPDWLPIPRKCFPPPPLPISQENVISEKIISSKSYEGILFDPSRMLGGEITHTYSKGGKFVSKSTQELPFSRGSQVWVDLFDPTKDETTKIKTFIRGVSRMGSQWVLELEWVDFSLLVEPK